MIENCEIFFGIEHSVGISLSKIRVFKKNYFN